MATHKGTPTKDGRCWYFTKYKDGVNHTSKKFMTKEECSKAESKFILKNDNPINKRFDLVAEEYLESLTQTKKESTIYTYLKDYNKHIYPYFKNFYINNINTQDIKKWAENLLKMDYSIEYLNKIYHLLKSIFDYGIKNYGLEINPVAIYGRFQTKHDKIIKDEEKLRYITKEEFDKFISVINDPLWHCFFITLYYTGCRLGEVLALTWEDINFNKNEIYINKTLYSVKGNYTITSTKTNKNRIIKMSKTLNEELYSYYLTQKTYKDYIDTWFVFGGSIHLATTTINRHKHKYFEESGVHEITIHEFRHSHVSLLINEYIKNNGKDMTSFFTMLSSRMGHTINVMQRTYMHLFPAVQDEIVDLLNNL
jgi:integrase